MNAVPLILCAAALVLPASAAQFVEVTATIETVNWHYQEETGLPLKNRRTHSIRCVVGKDLWLIENLSRTNITESTWLVNSLLIRQTRYNDGSDSTAETTGFRTFRRTARPVAVIEVDGYPGSDLLVNLPWFAFCSGPYLQRSTRGVPLPTAAPNRPVFGFTNETIIFPDSFGLPRNASFYVAPRQLKCRYEVQQSTNILGWNFPTAFTVVQNEPDRFGKWNRDLSVDGRVTSIRPVPKLELPEEILDRLESREAPPTRRR